METKILLYKLYNKFASRPTSRLHLFFRKVIGDYKYFSLMMNCEILPVINLYGKQNVCKKSDEKMVVLMFDGKIYNTGLADRIRAICSVYGYIKYTNIKLKVHHTKPFRLEDYLIPNEYDWSCDENDIDYTTAVPNALISFNGIFGQKLNTDLHKQYLKSLLKGSSKDIHLYTNTFCYDEDFFQNYHSLFKPSNRLQIEIDKIKKQIGDKYISISFRFAQLLGDLKDTFGEELDNEEKDSLINRCLDAVKNIYNKNDINKVLVTSDSVSFLKEVSKLPFVYLIPGKVGHIANRVSDEEVMKTFLDTYLISGAQKVYMVRSSDMFRSGFAKRAAMIGNVPFEEVIIL